MREKQLFICLIFLVLASLRFYSPTFLPIDDVVYKFIFYATVAMLSVLVYQRKRANRNSQTAVLDKAVRLLFLCQLLSALNAYMYKGQDLDVSILSTFQSAAFIVFIMLRKSDLSLQRINQLVKIFAVLFIVVNLLNHLSPTTLFGSSAEDASRGGVRYRLDGIYWVILFLFQKISVYAQHNEKKDLFWILLCSATILSTLTRQIIAVSMLMGLLILLKNSSWMKKIGVVLTISVAFVWLIPQIEVVNKLVEKTLEEKEAQEQYDNIRIVAFNYFAFEYPRNVQQVLFGCGVPAFGKSHYGNEFERTTYAMRVYREDVGWVGFYFNFGLVAVALLLFIMVRSVSLKISPEYIFLKYYVIAVLLLAIASAPILSNNEILVLVVGWYMMTLSYSGNSVKTVDCRIVKK